MRLRGYVRLAALCASLSMAAGAAAQEAGPFRVPDSIFNISPSPSGREVLFYHDTEAGGGYRIGDLYRLKLGSAQNEAVRVNVPQAAFNPPYPVWQADGSAAYFKGSKGIYRLNTSGGEPELPIPGWTEGLAISPDGLQLAFWRTSGKVGEGKDVLVLWDIEKKTEARTWEVPSGAYGSERERWDIMFTADGHALYARTYDREAGTPLQRFDIDNGGIVQVDEYVESIANSKKAIYYIMPAGSQEQYKVELHKIGADGTQAVVSKDFRFTHILQSANPRWIVAVTYHSEGDGKGFCEYAILDTETDTVKPAGTHDDVNVLSDGRLLLLDGTELRIAAGVDGQK